MKIIPKFLKGGNFDSLFSIYTPLLQQLLTSRKERSTTSTKEEEDKGKLTEKDFFNMLKDLDGLPNEMNDLVINLMNTLRIENLTGIETNDLASMYLSNLYKIKLASLNKAKYDKALEEASKNGSLAEPAISMDGKIIVLTLKGITSVDLLTYFENKDSYLPLTVSNLANLRAYDPSLKYNYNIIDIINNSMGFEAFQALLDKAKTSLGTLEITRNGMFSAEGEASKGLLILLTLLKDDRIQALSSVTAQGLYELKIIDKDLLNQINNLLNYILNIFPDRAKTWAALKLKTPNKNEATKLLIFDYLMAGSNRTHEFNIDYKGSMEKVKGSKESSDKDPKKGFWSLVQTDQGGDDFKFTLLNGRGLMTVDGKYYGTTPGLDTDKSLSNYINDSGIGYIIKNNKNITFGDVKISTNSFSDVLVSSHSGAAVVTLPIKSDGTVDLKIAEKYLNVLDSLEKSGLSKMSNAYNVKRKQLMKDNQLDGLLDSSGIPNLNRFGHFLVLEGYTSEKAKAIKDNKPTGFNDIKSDFIISVGDDNDIYDLLEKGLSSKDKGDYKLNRSWDFSLGYDNLYKGNIYIPLSINLIGGYNADNNKIKESTLLLYEKAYQQRTTSSSVIN